MQLTRFSDYALRALMVLAADEDAPMSVDTLATVLDVSAHHLGKVVHTLADAGFVRAKRGRGGGIELARAPDSLRVADVLRVTETGAPLVPCFSGEEACNLSPTCRLARSLAKAQAAFFAALEDVTLASLVAARSPARATLLTLRRGA